SRVGWSSAYLHDLQPGQTIRVRGPYGLMTLTELPSRPRLYIAEGSGIAPLKSQIDWLHECGFCQPIWLILSNPETPDQLPYQAYWRSLSQTQPLFHYREATNHAPEHILAAQSLDLSEFDVVVCAIGDRTEHLQTTALTLGARPDRLRSETFIAF
ncbi:hypothetical protein H6F43_10955, partial [Leptolyngbya sp. FACHB-36]|nr:hypothetical protein [Leptolyngbya sp. FACHB-36]